MKNKICPLLMLTDQECDPECQGSLCAWWVPPTRGREGHCAIHDLGALPMIGSEVRRI